MNRGSQFFHTTTLLASNPLLDASNHTKQGIELVGTSVNFISFTPGTSFQLRKSLGTKEERAIIYHLLKTNLRLEDGSFQDSLLINILQCNAGKTSWQYSISRVTTILSKVYDDFGKINWLKEWTQILRASATVDFIHDGLPGDPNKKLRMIVKGTEDTRADAFISNKNVFIGQCRYKLAKICLELLQPSLIIMDEFQNFSSLMYGSERLSIDSAIDADLLKRDRKVPVLLICATPYRYDPMDTDLSQKPAEDSWISFDSIWQRCRWTS